MSNNIRGGDAPIKCELEANKKYAWCSCGHSDNQPFCNGTHKTKGASLPTVFSVDEEKEVYLCTCKQTQNPPYCDGSHKN